MIGFLVAVVIGLVGMGGGTIMSPVLILFSGMAGASLGSGVASLAMVRSWVGATLALRVSSRPLKWALATPGVQLVRRGIS